MQFPHVFIDSETLGLDHERHAMWEFAAITRDEEGRDTEYLWQIRPTDEELLRAEPRALEINGFRERMQVPPWAIVLDMLHPSGPSPLDPDELDTILRGILTGAVLLGSNPDFDARFLRARLGAAVWRHRTVDVPTLAAGFLYGQARAETRTLSARTRSPYADVQELTAGWRSYQLSAAVGVEPPAPGIGHTALGDARWVRDLYDAITTPPGSHPAEQPHSPARRGRLPAAARRA